MARLWDALSNAEPAAGLVDELFEAQERELIPGGFSDPQSVGQAARRLPVAAGGQSRGAAVRCRQRELGDRAVRCDAPDQIALGKPYVAIRADRDIDRRSGRTRDRELRDVALHR